MYKFLLNLPTALSRITSGGKFIGEIDGLRFLAIFPVLLQHLGERMVKYGDGNYSHTWESSLTMNLVGRGFIGVYIFFVVSGFVLALPFASQKLNNSPKMDLKKYYWRRITRLEPPYIILMTIFFLILVVKDNVFTELFPRYLASITYLHNIIYGSYTPINPVAWSLEIEVQFYLLAPFLAAGIFSIKNTIQRRFFMVFLILGILVSQQYLGLTDKPWRLTIFGNLQLFLTGFLLADFYLVNWKEHVQKSYWFDFALLFLLPAPFFFWSYDFINWLVFPFILFALIFCVFKSVVFNRIFTYSWIMAIGGMCYTIYLIHLPIAEGMMSLTKGISVTNSFLVNFIVQLLIFLPVVFVVSVLFYLALEKPCMDKHWPGKLKLRLKKAFFKVKDKAVNA